MVIAIVALKDLIDWLGENRGKLNVSSCQFVRFIDVDQQSLKYQASEIGNYEVNW